MKSALLITDGNVIKKCQSNGKSTNIEKKLENEPKVKKTNRLMLTPNSS